MKRYRPKKFGPFSYFRMKKGRKNFLSAWLTGNPDSGFGWEWGTDDNPSNPAFCLRIANFNVFSYETFDRAGPTIFFLGFWWSVL